ncbi:MAG TPA: type IV toxin-antitoxin system AbiEi family antitoxin domain-containing protein [Jatrophihabitantaceae bacterium]|nr:type IV toxin-antitoxin system AbiEi family antitoxin domain-containing protein [Jatrophihabitantaceae bacterium]
MDWAGAAERQGGVVSLEQLCADGLSERAVTRMVELGALRRRASGVFTVRGAPATYTAQLWIAVLSTGGMLGFASAAHLWEMDEQPPRVHVIVGFDRRVKSTAAVRRHHVEVPVAERTRLHGLPITTRCWTLLDHLGRQPKAAAFRLADRALQQGWITHHDIARRVSAYPGRQGNVRLRSILDLVDDQAEAKSERLLHALLRRSQIRGWRANYLIRRGDVVIARADVAFPALRLAIEIDGFAYHSDVDRFQRDRTRQNALVNLGWTVLRFTWHDLVDRPDYVIATIRAHLPRS